MQTIKLTTPVTPTKNPTEKYKMVVEFDYGDDVVLLLKDTSQVFNLISLYTDYKAKLAANWNGWCDPVTEDILPLYNTYFPYHEYNEDNICEIWADSREYDCLARFERFTLTYFDKSGIEYNTTIER